MNIYKYTELYCDKKLYIRPVSDNEEFKKLQKRFDRQVYHSCLCKIIPKIGPDRYDFFACEKRTPRVVFLKGEFVYQEQTNIDYEDFLEMCRQTYYVFVEEEYYDGENMEMCNIRKFISNVELINPYSSNDI
jgi:hypothetical protein